MSPLFYVGRALGIVAAERRAERLAAQENEIDRTAPVRVPDERPTIAVALDNTTTLLERMLQRKHRLEDYIATSQEELRQVNVVIEGATQMQATISEGMRTTADPQLTDYADDVRAELERAFTPSELRGTMPAD